MATFDSTKTRLAVLLDEIEEGKIQSPDFQRGWVWDERDHVKGHGPVDFIHHVAVVLCQIVATTESPLSSSS